MHLFSFLPSPLFQYERCTMNINFKRAKFTSVDCKTFWKHCRRFNCFLSLFLGCPLLNNGQCNFLFLPRLFCDDLSFLGALRTYRGTHLRMACFWGVLGIVWIERSKTTVHPLFCSNGALRRNEDSLSRYFFYRFCGILKNLFSDQDISSKYSRNPYF